MCPGGYPIVSTQNWRSPFCRARIKARTSTRSITDVQKLIENIRNNGASPPMSSAKQLDLVQRLNERHLAAHQRDAQMEARIQSFASWLTHAESEATDAFDVEREPKHVPGHVGPGTPARGQLLTAGGCWKRACGLFRFGAAPVQPWDNHDKLEEQQSQVGRRMGPGPRGFL